jgi:hypothetical protein
MGKFVYSATSCALLERALSRARLSTYLRASKGGLQDALDLYVWNVAIGAAFYGPINALEVVLRNALHERLQQLFSPQWHVDPRFIALATRISRGQFRNPSTKRQPDLLSEINSVVDRVSRSLRRRATHPQPNQNAAPRITPTSDDVVAGLSFGFWVTILDPVFEPDLWAPGLQKAFPHFATITGQTLTRPPVARRLNEIRDFRNRIMHHEPIIARPLENDYLKIRETCSWILPDVSDWIEHHSRISALLATRHQPPHLF